jgi:hypothetical protein
MKWMGNTRRGWRACGMWMLSWLVRIQGRIASELIWISRSTKKSSTNRAIPPHQPPRSLSCLFPHLTIFSPRLISKVFFTARCSLSLSYHILRSCDSSIASRTYVILCLEDIRELFRVLRTFSALTLLLRAAWSTQLCRDLGSWRLKNATLKAGWFWVDDWEKSPLRRTRRRI